MKHVIFGESHGPAIGVTLSEVPAGIPLDLEAIRREMARRAPGKDRLSTARKEADDFEILSGVFDERTTGTPLCAVIRNTDTRSRDYQPDLPRPSHGDYAGFMRYDGWNDYRGGGHFSGRLTAPLVFAGAVAKQILALRGIHVGAHILQIGHLRDLMFSDCALSTALFASLADKAFPTVSDEAGRDMQQRILEAREAGDSVGGIVECAAIGVPAGFGSPDYGYNAEGIFAQQLFAIPAVKGVAFGAGFAFAEMSGSEANDPFYLEGNEIRTATNYAGGINGGITNGMPLVFTAAFRPTPSIAKPQQTVNLQTRQPATLAITGRHDPCIVHRAVPVVEAAAALALCQLMNL
jgi:chorismate synthase